LDFGGERSQLLLLFLFTIAGADSASPPSVTTVATEMYKTYHVLILQGEAKFVWFCPLRDRPIRCARATVSSHAMMMMMVMMVMVMMMLVMMMVMVMMVTMLMMMAC